MAGRIRTIKPELLEDTVIARLSDRAFRLYIASFLLADDYGNLRAEARRLIGEVYWGSDKISVGEVEVAIEELAIAGRGPKSSGLFELYSCRKQVYAHIRNWEKHQKVDHPGNPRCPSQKDEEAEPYRPIANLSRESPETVAPDLRSPITISITDPLSSASPPAGSDEPAIAPDQQSKDTETPTEASEASTPSQRPLLADMPTAEVEVFQHWVNGWKRTIGGPRVPKLDPKRKSKIRARLREGFTVFDLKLAIDGLWSSAWHLGENPDGKRYTDIELVCRDTSHVERFMGMGTVPDAPAEDLPSSPKEAFVAVPPPQDVLDAFDRMVRGEKPPLLQAVLAADAAKGANVFVEPKAKAAR